MEELSSLQPEGGRGKDHLPRDLWKGLNCVCISQVATSLPYVKAEPQDEKQLKSYSSGGLVG